MTPAETAAKLRHFNDWRRGELDDLSMPDPREVGEAIDVAIGMIERLDRLIHQEPIGWFARLDGDGPLMECKHTDIQRVPLYALRVAQPELNISDPAVQKRLAAQWGYVPAHQQADPIKDEREAFREWFESVQGDAFDGMWSFAKAAWLARAALGAPSIPAGCQSPAATRSADQTQHAKAARTEVSND